MTFYFILNFSQFIFVLIQYKVFVTKIPLLFDCFTYFVVCLKTFVYTSLPLKHVWFQTSFPWDISVTHSCKVPFYYGFLFKFLLKAFLCVSGDYQSVCLQHWKQECYMKYFDLSNSFWNHKWKILIMIFFSVYMVYFKHFN